jgi:hypothetical protein
VQSLQSVSAAAGDIPCARRRLVLTLAPAAAAQARAAQQQQQVADAGQQQQQQQVAAAQQQQQQQQQQEDLDALQEQVQRLGDLRHRIAAALEGSGSGGNSGGDSGGGGNSGGGYYYGVQGLDLGAASAGLPSANTSAALALAPEALLGLQLSQLAQVGAAALDGLHRRCAALGGRAARPP